MAGPPSIAIVIPVHDRREITRACLLALRAQTHAGAGVVVVDDGSTDGTTEMLARDFPEVTALRGDGDLWWTGATNLGCAWVLDRWPGIHGVVLLNDDTLPGPLWLGELVRAAQTHPRAVMGSLTVDAASGHSLAACRRVHWWTARYEAPLRGLRPEAVRARAGAYLEADLLSGTGTLVPAEALRRVGPFDRLLPHYGADYEFSRRAARAGWELLTATAAELPVRTDSTGVHASRGEDVGSLARSFWSRRSSTALPYRLRFALRSCPPAALPSYLVCDAVRTTGGALRDYLAAHGRAC
jgi:GT2 family glycosyltransferase